MAFDISNLLKPVVVRTSFLGTAEVEARTQSFYDWFRLGRDQKRWTDPIDLVRSLLAEQTSLKSTGKPLGQRQIDNLTTRQLNAFAKAFVKSARFLIAPQQKQNRTNNLHGRQAADLSILDRRPRERASTHLLRLLTTRDEEQRVIEQQRMSDLKKMIEGPAEWLRRIDPVGEQMEKLRREMIGPSLVGQMMVASTANAELTRLQAQSRLQAEEISRAVDRASGVGALFASAIRERDLLASQLADRTSAVSLVRDAVRSMTLGSWVADAFLGAEIARQAAWGDSIAKFLIPEITGGSVASIIGAHARMSVSAAIETAAGLSRGFRTAANVGLTGVAPRGAASEALRQYRADSPSHTDVFREVMRGIERLDVGELRGEDLSAALENAHATRGRIDLKDPVQVGIFLALMSLIVAVYVAILQQEGLKIARSSATSANVAAVTAEVKGLRNDLNRAREEDRSEWRDIRFVVDVTSLRAQPDRRSMVLLDVYPDQLVRILELKGAWARVEVMPYSSGEPTSGWISRTRLRARPT